MQENEPVAATDAIAIITEPETVLTEATPAPRVLNEPSWYEEATPESQALSEALSAAEAAGWHSPGDCPAHHVVDPTWRKANSRDLWGAAVIGAGTLLVIEVVAVTAWAIGQVA